MKSDPHLVGLRSQHYDVTGVSGKYYNLISDLNLMLNARFEAAYSTGMYIDDNSVVWPMRPKGTWMSEIGLRIGDLTPEDPSQLRIASLAIQASKQLEQDMGGALVGAEPVKYGSVAVGGVLAMAGETNVRDSVWLRITNTKQFSRVQFNSPDVLGIEFDIVPPPKKWNLGEDEQEQYTHINLKLQYASLSSDAHGLIGVSKDLKYDTNGEPIMHAYDKDGQGIIDGVVSDYEVPHLMSDEFKYSVTYPAIAAHSEAWFKHL